MNSRILLLPIIGVTTFFLLLLIYTKVFGPIPFSINSITTTKTTTFDVSGEGKVTASPDVALINAGINANATSVKAAQDQINAVINKVSDAVKKLGVDSKDIKTVNYNVNPNYDFGNGSKITGYSANTNLQIKVRQLDRANEVLDTVTGNGANQIGGVSFDIDDKTKFENQARQKAVDEAKKKASDAAKIAGFTLGKIVNYSENSGGVPRPVPMLQASDTKAQGGIPTKIEPGSTDIDVTVTLSYEIE